MLSAQLFDQNREPLEFFFANLGVQKIAARFFVAGLTAQHSLAGDLEPGPSEIVLDFIACNAMHPGPESPGIAKCIHFLYDRQQRFL